MSLIATLATCLALTAEPSVNCEDIKTEYTNRLSSLEINAEERDAIARVAFAEAANQGDDGLAGVVYTIINRTLNGDFGKNISAVLNARNQFEPVTRAGGDWKNLPVIPKEKQARVDTIISLALNGHLPDLTNGALFFQNPEIVKQREKDGKVSAGLTHFGGSNPVAQIKNHTFYSEIKTATQNKNAVKPKISLSSKKSRLAEQRRRHVTDFSNTWDEQGSGWLDDDNTL